MVQHSRFDSLQLGCHGSSEGALRQRRCSLSKDPEVLLMRPFLGLGCKMLSVADDSAEFGLHGRSGDVATGCRPQHLGSLIRTLHENFTLEIIVARIRP